MPSTSHNRRRAIAAVLAVLTICAGLGVHTALPDTRPTDAAGDILYAVLIQLLVVVALPRLSPLAAGALALTWCVAVELFQLTGLPELWGKAFPPLMLVFGTVFAPEDLVMYTIGIGSATAVDVAVRTLARTPRRGESGTARPAREETR